ncbi:hypothetical protein M9H77_24202 [Catharanthus roseus]|uniref:Uncharacterized protein n=1 Tax=Catharanthus roseus TaxID=4058 RepID=A0ACC0AWF1_CATRO|nr:hypothetical protein M9H77_24202 [Catharanthus roseus]
MGNERTHWQRVGYGARRLCMDSYLSSTGLGSASMGKYAWMAAQDQRNCDAGILGVKEYKLTYYTPEYEMRMFKVVARGRSTVHQVRWKRKTEVHEPTDNEIPVKLWGRYEMKKCNCPFLLKGEQSASRQFWKLTIQDGRHNYKIGVYPHENTQATQLKDDEITLVEEFSKCHMQPKNILDSIRGKNADCVVRFTYNMPLLETVGITSTENEDNLNKLKDRWHKMPDFVEYLFDTWLNFVPKFVRVWTGKILHFGSETTNRVEAQHSALKAWLTTSCGDLDIVFLKIHSQIELRVSEIKKTLESSRMIEKYNASSKQVLSKLLGNDDIRKIQKKWTNRTMYTPRLLLKCHSNRLVDRVPVAVRALEEEVDRPELQEPEVEVEIILEDRVRDCQWIYVLQIHP